jgi:inorganic pyrophosphatase
MKMPPPFADPDSAAVTVVIETPRGSRSKYSYDEALDAFRLKRLLPAGLSFPLDFGFVPGTRAGDGDPLDALVFLDEPAVPGLLVECRLIGILEVDHKKDGRDSVRNDRLLAVALQSDSFGALQDLDDVPQQLIAGINEFFVQYHRQAGNEYRPIGAKGKEAALERVRESMLS